MIVLENVTVRAGPFSLGGISLEIRRAPREWTAARVTELAGLLGIEGGAVTRVAGSPNA